MLWENISLVRKYFPVFLTENIWDPPHLEMSCCHPCWSLVSPHSSLVSADGSCRCCCSCWSCFVSPSSPGWGGGVAGSPGAGTGKIFQLISMKIFQILTWMMFSLSCRTWPRRTCSLFKFPVKKNIFINIFLRSIKTFFHEKHQTKTYFIVSGAHLTTKHLHKFSKNSKYSSPSYSTQNHGVIMVVRFPP